MVPEQGTTAMSHCSFWSSLQLTRSKLSPDCHWKEKSAISFGIFTRETARVSRRTQSRSPLMSTLPLYTRISSFSMIFNIRATFGSIIRLGHCCRMCFESLAIYAMSFRPFPTIFDDFQCFYGLSDVCSLISDLSLHRWTIYAFPIL